MSEAEVPLVTREEFAARVRALLRTHRPARPWPRRPLDRGVLLHAVARRLSPGEALTEREANQRIQDWLLGPGSALGVDFVTLRRALIDYGFWDREQGGSGYRRSLRYERWVRFEPGLPDELEVIAAAMDEAAERRRSYAAREGE